jgi:integrase/recombinase XerC/integrase/recombinase XerD
LPVIWQLGAWEGEDVDPVIVEHLGKDHSLARHLDDFLTDRKNAGASPHTLRAYRGDLLQFTAHCDGEIAELTAPPIREFLTAIGALSAATRMRKRAAVRNRIAQTRGPICE